MSFFSSKEPHTLSSFMMTLRKRLFPFVRSLAGSFLSEEEGGLNRWRMFSSGGDERMTSERRTTWARSVGKRHPAACFHAPYTTAPASWRRRDPVRAICLQRDDEANLRRGGNKGGGWRGGGVLPEDPLLRAYTPSSCRFDGLITSN